MKALLVMSFLFLNLSAHASECKVFIAEATKCAFDTQDGCWKTFEDTSVAKRLSNKGYEVVENREEAEFSIESHMFANVLWLNEGQLGHVIKFTDLKTNLSLEDSEIAGQHLYGLAANFSLTLGSKLATRRAWKDMPKCSELNTRKWI